MDAIIQATVSNSEKRVEATRKMPENGKSNHDDRVVHQRKLLVTDSGFSPYLGHARANVRVVRLR
jgi:hypothetical protein